MSKEMSQSAWDNERYGEFFYSLTPTKRKKLRTLEKINGKLVELSLSAVFNERCLKEKLLPQNTLIFNYIKYRYT